MSATVPERIAELWERADDRAQQIAKEKGGGGEGVEASASDIIAVLVEEVAALSKRVEDAGH